MGLFGFKKKATAPTISYITMGSWQGEPIRWKVLSEQGDRLYLLSVYAVDGMYFNQNKFQGNEFEFSDIHWWLNSPFYKNAFTPEEKEKIIGEITLLSVEEIKKYSVERVCEATEYAKNVKNLCNPYVEMLGEGLENAVMWWLRDKAHLPSDVKIVGFDGCIMNMGVIMPDGGVRPAMWIQKSP